LGMVLSSESFLSCPYQYTPHFHCIFRDPVIVNKTF
jgi:hypothetical protein